jgi:hypothetical protein
MYSAYSAVQIFPAPAFKVRSSKFDVSAERRLAYLIHPRKIFRPPLPHRCPTPLPILVRVKMNKKQKFIQAVRILAPDNNFIIELAQRVREDDLPTCPGGAALEFVAALMGINGNRCPRRAIRCPISHTRTAFRSSSPGHASRITHHESRAQPVASA